MRLTNQVISRFIRLLIAVSFICIGGCGERYKNEGNRLKEEINRELIAQHLCLSVSECNKIFVTYSGHDNHVNFSFYAPDRFVLAVVFKFLIEKGIIITNGVPISIKVYPKPIEEYKNNLFNAPIITLEITQ